MGDNVKKMIDNQKDFNVSAIIERTSAYHGCGCCVGNGDEELEHQRHGFHHEEQREGLGKGGSQEELPSVGHYNMHRDLTSDIHHCPSCNMI